ncbi:stalk domain-containing protein [Paenibacillus sp. JX-17]|uniref:Stalk domain-containing protein n=1 Tax=Paenibacillus lacisoli TaxID=3064525 RepID=A0ABT9CCE5_9BACL|nr:stalk domain-containing protein [Paenibacillus sp. JX-17]MDO7906550.1 stalk domain-containing protein [Paenibacillus sp. JX-17]
MNGHEGKTTSGAWKRSKTWVAVSLAGVLLAGPAIGVGPVWQGTPLGISTAEAAALGTVKLGEEVLTSGAVLMKYKYTTTRSGKTATALADVIRVDLTNPYVKLDVMTGKNGQFTTKQSTGGMALETGAVAGVNGDYFNTSADGAPIGGQVSDGELMSTPSDIKGMYAFAVTKSGKPMIEQFTFEGNVTAADGATFPIEGMNKASYTPESGDSNYSHVNKMYIYTSAWKSLDRPKNSATTPTEVLVQNGVVKQIAKNSTISSAIPEDGYILRTHGTAATFVNTHLKVGDTIKADYQLRVMSTQQAVDPADLQMMIGGHTILVDNGKKSAYSRDVSSIGGYRARTALGYSSDNKYAYVIAAQKNEDSSGMSLGELQNFMVSIGVWKGLNLDGGGSTTMVTRPLGEQQAQLTFDTEYGTQQRSIVNGLGIYTEAPKGTLKGFTVSGSKTLLIGQQGSYALKGYDTYYNPYDISGANVSWTSSNSGIIAVSNGKITGVKPGTATLTASSGSARSSIKVEVLGASQLSSLTAGSGTGALTAGASLNIPVTAKTKSGQTIALPADSLKWQFIGLSGTVQGNTLTINSVNPSAQVGYAIGCYDGFSTVVVLSKGGQTQWENFENVGYPISFTTNAAGVTGSAVVKKGSGDHAASNVLELQYNMTAGSGKMYAYAQLNGTTGKAVSAPAAAMSLDVMGDKSLNWLRAEFTDAAGKTVYVDLAKVIDWTGWKTLNIDLSGSGLTYPAKLKRMYVVNVEEGQDERAKSGTVAFDNISFNMPSLSSDAGLPTGTALMAIGQKSMVMNGQKSPVDVAPIIRNNSTYVPIKYILDAFGGQASWDAANQRVSVWRGSKMLDLTVGQKELIMNGKRISTEVSPIIVNGRTLVPLRLVSEQLGFTVKWEQKTKTVTIQS